MATDDHTLRWTVLPDGVVGKDPGGKDVLRLSVLITPRLTGSDRLGGYQAFAHWPDTLNDLTAKLWLECRDNADRLIATVTDPRPADRFPPADRELWARLFRASTPVHVRPPAAASAAPPARTLRSYPGSTVRKEMTSLYEQVGVATTQDRVGRYYATEERLLCEPPDPDIHQGWRFLSVHLITPMIGDEVLDFAVDPRPLYDRVETVLGTTGGGGGGGGDPRAAVESPYTPLYMRREGNTAYEPFAKEFAFAEAHRFYDRGRETGAPDRTARASEPPEEHEVDFHEACAMLGDYPELQRRFGLVVDLLFTVPDGFTDGGTVRVAFDSHPDHERLNAPGLRPRTRVRYTAGERFEALAADESVIRTRVLDLGTDGWEITDLDVDGSALKYVDYARAVAGFRDELGNYDDHAPARRQLGTGTPAARGGGITVLRTDHDSHLARRIGADGERSATAADPELTAEDLVRGYRIDVGTADPATGTVSAWRSLCRRRGGYTVRWPGETPLPITVGDDEGHVRSSAVTSTAPGSTDLYAHQALFGWDGWSLVAQRPGKTLNLDDRPEAVVPPVSPDVPLETRFTPVAGSLPALRYGRTYRMRARVVDLAGNGLDHTATVPDDLLSPTIAYLRWEPVPQPVVVPTRPFSEGESAERLVIRSTVEDDGREISALAYSVLRSDVPDHGRDSGLDGLDRRYRHFDQRHIAPPKSALRMAEEHGAYDAAFGANRPEEARQRFFASAARESGSFLDTVVSYPDDPERTRDLLRFGEIHVAKHDVHDTEPLTELPLPYRGAGLKTGEFVVHDARQLLLPYLPDPLARGVCLRGLPGRTDNLKIPFEGPWPQAKPFLLRLEEGDDEPRWQDTALWRELTVYLVKSESAKVFLSCYLDAADLPLMRQWRLLTDSEYWRDLGEQEKAFVTRASADGENWMLTPWTGIDLVHAVEKPLVPPELLDLVFDRTPEATFAEVRGGIQSHPYSTGRVGVDGAWSEWTDDITRPGPERSERRAHLGEIDIPSEAELWDLRLRHEFGDTRHRNVAYTPTATTRFREYFHPTITDDPALITRVGPVTAGPSGQGWAVPSSRRPEPPEPSHVMPTFRWSRTVDHDVDTVTQSRRPAGVRVYLHRPWFSSGDDEMLAVVLDPAGTAPDRYVTRAGTDPVWAAATALPGPAPEHFPNADTTATGLLLAESTEAAPLPVSIAAFRPVYDEERRLWYCDIDLDLGDTAAAAYFPYLRLALARYQPYALPGLELSKVITAEFAQVIPARTVTASTVHDRPRVRLSGPTTFNELGERLGTGLAAVSGSRRVTATLQSRGALGEDDMDWKPVGVPVALTCQPDGTGFAWSVDLPAADTRPLTLYRLLIEEHELYRTDPDTATETVTVDGQPAPVARRLVHADYIALRRGLLGGLFVDLDPDS